MKSSSEHVISPFEKMIHLPSEDLPTVDLARCVSVVLVMVGLLSEGRLQRGKASWSQSYPWRLGPRDYEGVWSSAPVATRNTGAHALGSSSLEKDECLASHSLMWLSHTTGPPRPPIEIGSLCSLKLVPCSELVIPFPLRALSSPRWLFFCSKKTFYNT